MEKSTEDDHRQIRSKIAAKIPAMTFSSDVFGSADGKITEKVSAIVISRTIMEESDEMGGHFRGAKKEALGDCSRNNHTPLSTYLPAPMSQRTLGPNLPTVVRQ